MKPNFEVGVNVFAEVRLLHFVHECGVNDNKQPSVFLTTTFETSTIFKKTFQDYNQWFSFAIVTVAVISWGHCGLS